MTIVPAKGRFSHMTNEEAYRIADIVAHCLKILRSPKDDFSAETFALAENTLLVLFSVFEFDEGFRSYIKRQAPTRIADQL